MLGGAAAAIAGLTFVALSIHLRTIASTWLLPVRARFVIIGITSVVVVAGLCLIPGQGRTALGVELVVFALVLAVPVVSLLAITRQGAWSLLMGTEVREEREATSTS